MTVEISFDQLPSPEDSAAVFAFAMTFNGYSELGSLEAAAAAAREKRRASLLDIRNELFFSARASRHRQDDEYLARYRELLPYFHRLLATGQST
jgi:hypothetical protein